MRIVWASHCRLSRPDPITWKKGNTCYGLLAYHGFSLWIYTSHDTGAESGVGVLDKCCLVSCHPSINVYSQLTWLEISFTALCTPTLRKSRIPKFHLTAANLLRREILPSAHRATGSGLAVGANRVMGIFAIIVASYSDVTSTAPLFICAALFFFLAIWCVLLPFEPRGKKAA